MTSYRMIIISDHHESARALATILGLRGFQCTIVNFHPPPLQTRANDSCDLVLIDANGQQTDALTVCRQIRSHYIKPILLLTYERDERYHIESYRSGVSERIAKPMGMELLVFKIMAWLTCTYRVDAKEPEVKQGGFHLNAANMNITTPEGRSIRLSKLEGDLMSLFLNNPGRILDTQVIVHRIWSFDGFDDGS
ncbi:MAG TPA: response regulator, partial [Caldilineaceae bacterium]|nr:response regulator [Caldilineaceae bacterium]